MYARRERRPRRWLWTLGLIGIFVLIGVLFAPRVIGFTPSSGSEDIPSRSSLNLEFSQSMDPISVETRLSVDPDLPGEFEWHGRQLTFQPLTPWPRGERVTVRLQAGSRSAQFLPILRSYTWSFTVGEPRVAYLWPASGPSELFTRGFENESTRQITESPFGIIDFTLGMDGTTLAYSQLREDGGSDLLLHDLVDGQSQLVVSCPEGIHCQNLALSPDSERLAFERVGDITQVWVASDTEQGPVSEGESLSPAWSRQGMLAYYDPASKQVVIYEDELLRTVPNSLGMLGTWSPEGSALLLPEIAFPDTGEDYISHLVRVEIESGELEDLSKYSSGEVEDATPIYSPDGEWVAFARKYVDERWTPGRQLWVMRTDGTAAQPLTDAPDFNHSSFAWSPDSGSILFTRFHVTDPSALPEIWVVQVESQAASLLVQGGILPQWIP